MDVLHYVFPSLFSQLTFLQIGFGCVTAATLVYLLLVTSSFLSHPYSAVGASMLGTFLGLISKAQEKLKTFVANSFSIDTILAVSKYLPVGSLLDYEQPDIVGANSIHEAMRDRDEKKVRSILNLASEKALDKYLSEKTVIGTSILDFATIHCDTDYRFLKILLERIKPEKRLAVFQADHYLVDTYLFNMVNQGEKVINIVMASLPLQDRFTFINQVDEQGNTPFMRLASRGRSVSTLKSILNHCPKQHLFDYLTRSNNEGKTALMLLFNVTFNVDAPFNFILNAIPANRRKEFLEFNKQAEKVMLVAHIDKRHTIIKTLKRCGIAEPAQIFEEDDDLEDRFLKLTQEWEAKENFKKKYGEYPHAVLGLAQETNDPTEVKKAYYLGMLKYHPDRNKDMDATEKSQIVISAYEFFTKPETHKNYLKPK